MLLSAWEVTTRFQESRLLEAPRPLSSLGSRSQRGLPSECRPGLEVGRHDPRFPHCQPVPH